MSKKQFMKGKHRLAKWLAAAILLFNVQAALAFSLPCRDPFSEAACGKPVFLINDTLDTDSLLIKIKLSAVDSAGNITIIYTTQVPLSNIGYFQHLGSVVFDPSDPVHTTYHGYRFIFTGYTALAGTFTQLNFNFFYKGSHITKLFKSFYNKTCGNCPSCPTRLLVMDLIKVLPLRYFSFIAILDFPGYGTFPTMGSYQQGVTATMLNWFLDKNASVADYVNMTNPAQVGNSNVPPSFCGGSGNVFTPPPVGCECKAEILALLKKFRAKMHLINSTPNPDLFAEIMNEIKYVMRFGCLCREYCFFLESKNIPGTTFAWYELLAIPYSNAFSPTFIVWANSPSAGPGSLSAIAVSYNYTGAVYNISNAFSHFPPDSSLYYDTGTNNFVYNNGFSPYGDSLFGAECSFDCVDCIGSFAPIPGKKYIVSLWAKEDNAPQAKTSYTFPNVTVQFPSIAASAGPFYPTGVIVDGWQKIEAEFMIPGTTTDLQLKLACDTGNCFFDDVRVFPFDGSMKSYVYDPVSMRLVAELDERNYATRYEYDEEGKLIRVKKETERGNMTIQENRNNTKK